MPPRTALMVNRVFLSVIPPHAVPVNKLLFLKHVMQGRGRTNGFSHHPVHTQTHHRIALPINGVNKTGGAINVPPLQYPGIKQAHRCWQKPCRCRFTQATVEVHQEARPLTPVTKRRTIGTERVSVIASAIITQGTPILINMLNAAPMLNL